MSTPIRSLMTTGFSEELLRYYLSERLRGAQPIHWQQVHMNGVEDGKHDHY